MKAFKLAVFLVNVISPILCYKTGAPTPTCEKMTPFHGAQATTQKIPSPFKVMLNTTRLSVSDSLEITLTSKSGNDEFKGFLVQVRNVSRSNEVMDGEPMGEFMEETEDARFLHCSNTPNTAMTHNSPTPKKKVILYWTPDTPGLYRVFTTFVKNYDEFWTSMVHDQLIEVTGEGSNTPNPIQTPNKKDMSIEYDWDKICKDMKLTEVPPITDSSNPYSMKIEAVKEGKIEGDNHKIYQKGLLWINITSDFDTPIMKIFMEVRKPKTPSKAYGKFLINESIMMTRGSRPATHLSYKLVHCFGEKENAILFININHKKMKTSDVSFQWEAPHDETGEFEVVGTIMKDEETFWNNLGDDKAETKIRVIKAPSTSSNKRPSKNKNSSTSLLPLNALIILFSLLLI